MSGANPIKRASRTTPRAPDQASRDGERPAQRRASITLRARARLARRGVQ